MHTQAVPHNIMVACCLPTHQGTPDVEQRVAPAAQVQVQVVALKLEIVYTAPRAGMQLDVYYTPVPNVDVPGSYGAHGHLVKAGKGGRGAAAERSCCCYT